MKMTTMAAAVLALSASSGGWAVPAGRVLAVAGTATIERAGQQLPLQADAAVESGDVLAVGDKSMLQVRFTDESVVALRANSEFKIEDYRFDKSTDSDRSILGLLKGGMRTITGLIAKANQSSYAVRTATSTIGIRGTHFTLVSCDNDCTNPDGTQVQNGTFGGVTDGRISVSNDAGEQEFGQQEFFHVPNANTPPIRLLAPPAVLNDRGLVVRGRGTGGSTQGAGASSVSPSTTTLTATAGSIQGTGASSGSGIGSGTKTSTSPQLVVQSAPVTELIAPLTTFSSTELPAITTVKPDDGSNNQITVVESFGFTSAVGIFPEANAMDFSVAELRTLITTLGTTLGLNSLSFTNAATLAAAIQATSQPVGSSAAAAAYWTYEPPEVGVLNNLGSHNAWGDTPLIPLPTTGMAQYNFVGGTAPTDNFGRIGTFTGSNLMMNFGSQQITNISAMSLKFGTNALQLTPTSYSIPASTTWAMGGAAQTISGATCSGCYGVTQALINGRFVGTNLQGYVAAITVSNPMLDTFQKNVAGTVAAFAKK